MNSQIKKTEESPTKEAQTSFFQAVVTRIFKFCASLKLAIFILAGLIIAMSVGTFVESLHGATAAKLVVYEAWWFYGLLYLLVLNLLASAFDRLPWKKKHAGFVLTHAGIIILLFGSFLTAKTMIDGQMVIQEGDSEHFITLPEPLLYVFSHDEHRDRLFKIKSKPFVWKGEEKIGTVGKSPNQWDLFVLQNFPKGLTEDKIVPAEIDGKPAVEVNLQSSFVKETVWLIQDDSQYGWTQMGPAKLVFTHEFLKEAAPLEKGEAYLEIVLNNRVSRVPIKKDQVFPASFPIENSDLKLILEKSYRNAVVDGKNLIEDPAAKPEDNNNPAIQLTVEGADVKEKHTVFSKFPEFPTIHGMKPSAVGIKLSYHLANSGSKGETHELRFVYTEDPETKEPTLFYQLQKGMEVKTGKTEAGKSFSTGWMGMEVHVKQFLPKAKIEKKFSPVPNTSQNERAYAAIQVAARKGGEEKLFWLGQGDREKVVLGDQLFNMMYGQKRISAGFKLQLKDFKIEKYPGTDRPASFASDVVLKDDMRGLSKDAHISMNEPLIYRGYRIYQSGYNLPEGQPEISIFSVGKDPGVPLKYLGAIVMVLGIVIMYYTRKFSTRAGQS